MKIIKLLIISFFFFAASFGYMTAQNNKKMVVAHFMIGLSMNGNSVADLKKEIIDAHNQGVEAFQLNINHSYWNKDDTKQTTANMYQAASECNFPFYLFLSAGLGGEPVTQWGYDDIYNYLRLYRNHPNQLYIEGRPLFTSWLGERLGVVFWRNIKTRLLAEHGINIFYVPYHATFVSNGNRKRLTSDVIGNYLAEWNGVIDGYFWWGASLTPFSADSVADITLERSIPSFGEYLSDALKKKNLPFMTPMVPAFWATCKEPCKYTEHAGAKGMVSQWMSIINNQTARWVNLVTWNDSGEDSYWSPNPTPSSAPRRSIYSHAGYAELNKYYIQWWKTGQQPTIEKDKIFYFYRTQLHDAVPLIETCTFNCNDRTPDKINATTHTIPDKVYVTTMLVKPAILTIYSGSKTTVHTVSAGIYNWDAEMGVGSQRFTIARGADVVIDITGEKLVDKLPQYKSRSLFSGFSESVLKNR
jgi:glucan endo-1,3-alpha-glucosidase